MNINTLEFWDSRFASDEWGSVGGREQTRSFAVAQSRFIRLTNKFTGSIVDFGCGLGDAIPVYRQNYPAAKLTGVDFSPSAIAKCIEAYGESADFVCGDHASCPSADIIIASNVLEHLENDQGVAHCLFSKCRDLYIIVPYREQHLIDEHLRAYDRHSFDSLAPIKVNIFASKGWSQYGTHLWWEFRFKNVLRPFFGKKCLRRRMQIMYQFHNSSYSG